MDKLNFNMFTFLYYVLALYKKKFEMQIYVHHLRGRISSRTYVWCTVGADLSSQRFGVHWLSASGRFEAWRCPTQTKARMLISRITKNLRLKRISGQSADVLLYCSTVGMALNNTESGNSGTHSLLQRGNELSAKTTSKKQACS